MCNSAMYSIDQEAWLEKQEERQDIIAITYCGLDQDAENTEGEKEIQMCFEEEDKVTQ